jgi:hypothetical protein
MSLLAGDRTIWLVLIDAALGLAIVACVVVVVAGVVREIIARRRSAAPVPPRDGDRVFESPGLGCTMADGGEPVGPDAPPRRPT